MKSGHVFESGAETDPCLIRYVDNYNMVYGHFKSTDENRHDYHTFEVDKKYKEIEGTEKQIPDLTDFNKVSCTINYLQDYTGNRDLDNDFHKGFTIGKGKQLYWMFIWCGTGNVTVYPVNNKSGRWIPGDTKITIHFK